MWRKLPLSIFLVLLGVVMHASERRMIKVEFDRLAMKAAEHDDFDLAASTDDKRDKTKWLDPILTEIEKCTGDKWTGLLSQASKLNYRPKHVAEIIASQVKARILGQGLPIYQGCEGVCGVVALEYIMTIVDPQNFAVVVRDLWCTGKAKLGPRKKPTKIPSKTYKCQVSSGAEISYNTKELFHLNSRHNDKKIRAADWLFVAGLEETTNNFFGICGSVLGQGQTPIGEKVMADVLFGGEYVQVYGGMARHVGKTIVNAVAMAGTVGQKRGLNRHLNAKDWQKVIRSVQEGSAAALTIDTRVGERLDGMMGGNHFVVLTAILDKAYGTTPCATKMLKGMPACVVWTWAQYYVWESCGNLGMNVADAVVVNHRKSATPEVWKPGNTTGMQVEVSKALEDINEKRKGGDFHKGPTNWRARSARMGTFTFVPRIFHKGETIMIACKRAVFPKRNRL